MRPPFHPILLLILIATYSLASAATLHVPADHPTIQSCIDAAISSQDECVVAPGTYNELINFLGKAITLRSSHGPEVTTIDGTGLNGSVATCTSEEGPKTVLKGFTIRGGIGTIGYKYRLGGGMLNLGSSPTVIDCIFIANRAREGGGMYNSNGNPVVSRCVFTRNAAVFGAGMFNGGRLNDPSSSSPTVSNCLFERNVSESVGGGMFNIKSSPTITSCIFTGNSARYAGGGIRNDNQADATVINCTFSGNFAYMYGGGMQNEQCNPNVVNCTFSGNKAHLGIGGAMDNYYGATPNLAGCLLWGNSPDEFTTDSDPTVRFCNIRGGLPAGAVDAGGNIDVEPFFARGPNDGGDGWTDDPSTPASDEGANDDYGDLRLQASSPCINAGDLNFVPQPGETDFDGHARVLCGRIDMGAYEFGIGDFDCDQAVTLADFSAWPSCSAAQYHSQAFQSPIENRQSAISTGCEALDFEFDLDLDLRDFAAWQNLFGH